MMMMGYGTIRSLQMQYKAVSFLMAVRNRMVTFIIISGIICNQL